MRNEFSQKTRDLFFGWGWQYCWVCGKNCADALHHIKGRVSNSPYNAAPVCNMTCHIGKAMSPLAPMLLEKTERFLEKLGYIPKQEDKLFLEKYKRSEFSQI